jgi:hypothetical protein
MLSLIKNPFVIITAAVLIALTGGALAALTGSQPPEAGAPGATLDSSNIVRAPALAPTASPAIRSAATADVRTLPSEEARILGTLRRGQELDIVGRSSDGAWIAIAYPPGSAQHGWIAASVVDHPEQVRIAPTVTPAPFRASTPPDQRLPEATTSPSPGPRAPTVVVPQPDLVVGNVDLLGDGRLLVNVRNQGAAPVDGRAIEVALASANGQILGLAGAGTSHLGPGESVAIIIPYAITQPMGIRILVDPNGRIAESARGNDVFEAMVRPPVVPAVLATPTATVTPQRSVTAPATATATATPRLATVTATPAITPTATATAAATVTATATVPPPPTPEAHNAAPTPTVPPPPGPTPTGPFSAPPPQLPVPRNQ